MAKYPCLTQRKGTYYVRKTVPTDIQDSFGKPEVWRSLGTKKKSEALTKYPGKLKELDELFGEYRRCGSTDQPDAVSPVASLSDLTILLSCDQHYQNVIDLDFAWRADLLIKVRDDGEGFGLGKYIEHPRSDWYNVIYEELEIDDLLIICVREQRQMCLKAAEKQLALADISEHTALARQMATERGLHLTDADQSKLARKLLEREIHARKDILSGDQSRYDAILEKCALSTIPASPHSVEMGNGDPGPHLSSLLDKFKAEGEREGLAVRTLMGDRTDLQEFISVAGDKAIRSYKKADAIKFKEVLSACPANRKSKQYRGLSIADCASLAEKFGIERRLATSTINDKLNAISKFFGWASDHLGDVANPFEGTRIKVKKKRAKRSEDRLPFHTDELQQIFSSTVFTGCKSKTSWKVPGSKVLRESARYWAPLIALFSGLRLGEIIQMRTGDIKTDANGIRYFDVTAKAEPDDGEVAKSLKTTTSERQVPVHPFLFECGLQGLIDKRQEDGAARLLMDYGRAPRRRESPVEEGSTQTVVDRSGSWRAALSGNRQG